MLPRRQYKHSKRGPLSVLSETSSKSSNETEASTEPAEGSLTIETKHGRGYYSEGVTSPERLCADDYTKGPRVEEFASSPTHACISPRKESKPADEKGEGAPEDAGEGAHEEQVDAFNEGDPYEAMFAHLDYSKRSVEPKVNYISGRAGDPPRKVEIERKKREYEAKDLRALLLERGVNFSVPLQERSFLPLELFDDSSWDVRTPAEWIELGLEKRVGDDQCCVPGLVLEVTSDMLGEWVECRMVGFDSETKLYKVRLTMTGTELEVARVMLMMLAEDPTRFADRVSSAMVRRKAAEKRLRYALYVDSMPNEDNSPLNSEQVSRMLRSALNTQLLRNANLDTTGLVEEANIDFGRTMNQIVFDKILAKPANKQLAEQVGLGERGKLAEVPDMATILIPDHDFGAQCAEFAFNSYLTKSEVITAIQRVRQQCNMLLEQSLLHTTFIKTMRYDEFEGQQTSALNTATHFIKDSWVVSLKSDIKHSLKDVGKGWFDLSETNRDIYEYSKLKRLLVMANMMMEDSLRFMVESSVTAYEKLMLESAAGRKIIVNGTSKSQIEILPVEGFSEEAFRRPPLFLLDLSLKDDRPNYNIEPSKFVDMCLGVVTTGLNSLTAIEQLEHQIMDQMFWPVKDLLKAVSLQEDHIAAVHNRIKEALINALQPIDTYRQLFDNYIPFTQMNIEAFILELESNEDTTLHDIVKKITYHNKEKEKAEVSIPPEATNLGLFSVTAASIRDQLMSKHDEVVLALQTLILRMAAKKALSIIDEYKEINTICSIKPKDVEQLAETREYMKTVPELTAVLDSRIDELRDYYDALDTSCCNLENDAFNLRLEGLGWPGKLDRNLATIEEQHEECQRNFEDNLRGSQGKFKETLLELATDIDSFRTVSDFDRVKEMAAQADTLGRKLKKCEEEAKKINSREFIFGQKPTEYSDLPNMTKKFGIYSDLWRTACNWIDWQDFWLNGPIEKIEFEQMRNDFEAAKKTMQKAARVLKTDHPLCAEIAENVKGEMEKFADDTCNLSLIEALRNPGMKDRHWDELSEKLGMDVHPDSSFKLKQALEMGLGKPAAAEVLTKIADVAQKQFIIEGNLNSMEEQWEGTQFEVQEYKETGTFVVKGSDEVNELLDDHIVQVQAMSFSPFKGPFEERIATWERNLVLLQDVLSEWLMLQRQWMYLEPIFSSEDINRQLPVEGKKFASCNKFWRKTMESAHMRPQCINFAQDRLLADFKDYNETLDRVQKNLAEYLETKRAGFARFYFLSDEDLIQILSQTKEPTAVQKHLGKCFEAIALLEFEGTTKAKLTITKMYSPEKECINFVEPVRPQGNVEYWLGEVEKMMCLSVREVLEESIITYAERDRNDWVTQYPGMVVLQGSQTYWTSEVEEALNTAGSAGLRAYLDVMLKQLEGLVQIVRGKMSKLTGKTMGALITIDVHARDVIEEMCNDGIDNVGAFEWVKQLRYYWEEYGEMSCPIEKTGRKEMCVRQVQCCFPYGYEYLGNSMRLVITPLTDRCYMTLMGAIHMNLGGAPAGPAGTGKTETTKDLGKALAKQCVVFNCSDGLDYKAMEKFFKGLAQSGAWACFDEFNRIDIEVLSVVAQQILEIQQAVAKNLKRFNFQGTEIGLIPTCNVYITMNPGYAGRTELPDNLKALFRPVAMMVPDYALIAQIRLYSFGFHAARPLSKKLVGTFTLSSEQLSSQCHYDFGMRAVNSVVVAVGNLKRKYPDGDEEVLLLRGLRDVNKPKFLEDDLVLFSGIISDLFPGVPEPDSNYPELEAEMEKVTTSFSYNGNFMGLQYVEMFKQKMLQLYEMTVVRHGLMVVGPTGSGKTCISRVLSQAQTNLAKVHENDEDWEDYEFRNTRIFALNPKSITLDQLYGTFDLATGEWTDGVGAILFRHQSAPDEECGVKEDDRKWFYFDGPVDAIWIESMNTVLDDNKKLCLVSGEIIRMSETMTMMFEPEDLAVASPATVSRCGMVFVEPQYLEPNDTYPAGECPLVKGWLTQLPPNLLPHADQLQALFSTYLWPCLYKVRKFLKEVVKTVNTCIIPSQFKLMDCMFEPYFPKEGRSWNDEYMDLLKQQIEPVFLWALVWSIGATITGADRPAWDSCVRDVMKENDIKIGYPEEGTVYDYALQLGGDVDGEMMPPKFVDWLETVPKFELANDLPYAEKIVPTKDSVSAGFVIKLLAEQKKHLLGVGETGTAKSVTIQRTLKMGLKDNFDAIFTAFSAQTSANQTQDVIDDKFDKRRQGKANGLEFLIHGPPIGKNAIIFVDDMNMPKKETYGAQPPIELLRQWMDYQGWYDRKINRMKKTVDIAFVGAMGPPGGGKQEISNRFLRHFNFLAFVDMSQDSLEKMFSTILSTHLHCFGFQDEIQELCDPIVKASIAVYFNCLEQMLPTPSKSHYTFNLRDLGKIFQGCLNSTTAKMNDPNIFLRLWAHESNRVIRDRLINNEDRELFDSMIKDQLKEKMNIEYSELVTAPVLVFGDFTEGIVADPKIYEEISDMGVLRKMIDDYLEDYDSESKQPMRLVLFMDAIEHVSRINRVLRLPLGNALLCGVGGSGRKSLTRLACYMADYKLFMIEIGKNYGSNEWREDIKKVLRTAGLDAMPICFLFDDSQIVQESFLEDINGLLNAGEVPNLWKEDELGEIYTAMTPILQGKGITASKLNMAAEFVNRCKNMMHIVLCMSPIGGDFGTRLRNFPSLVNCCTIDWFSEWPFEALKSVARDKNVETEFDTEEIRAATYEMFVFIHQSVERAAGKFMSEMRRHCYVTPTSYLEQLNLFQTLLTEEKTKQSKAIARLGGGVKKIDDAEALVDVLKVELSEKMPILVKTNEEVTLLMESIERDKKDAEVVEKEASVAEADANEKKATAEGIAGEAKGKLDVALPALYAALANVDKLQKKDIDEMKALGNPPARVKLVMAAVCIYMKEKPTRVQDPDDPKKKIDDYWKQSQKLLNDPKAFISNLKGYDKDATEESVVKKITQYVENPDLDNDKVKSTSSVCFPIMLWVRAMYDYFFVSREVEPLRQAAAAAAETLAAAMASLAEAQGKLKAVTDKLDALNKQFEEANAKKAALEADVELTNLKLSRADKLLGGLGGERQQWRETVAHLRELERTVVGNVLVAAGSIGYLGVFVAEYRADLVEQWKNQLVEIGVPTNMDTASLRGTLEDPNKVLRWGTQGLPSDGLSIENAIMMDKARRWPLCIDPQMQANKWIKKKEEKGLGEDGVCKATDSTTKLQRALENAVRFGRTMLLENVTESLDPSLESVLLRQIFKQGGTDMMKLGDSVIAYDHNFKFYMCTNLRNPHYAPEVSVKVSLLNFMITANGLEEQLLGVVVGKERPDCEEKKTMLVEQNAKMKEELTGVENSILALLEQSGPDILDEDTLINALDESGKMKVEIEQKMEEAAITEKETDQAREEYRPCAYRSQLLFFCVADLGNVDPMYQYSLAWFKNLFLSSIVQSQRADTVLERMKHINEHFTYNLYDNICRGILEKDKLIFAMTLVVKLLQGFDKLDPLEWRFILAGPPDLNCKLPNPDPTWITDKMWVEISKAADVLEKFQGLDDDVTNDIVGFKKYFDNDDPDKISAPGVWADRLGLFQELILLRAIRPDKMLPKMTQFIAEAQGKKFTVPPVFDLNVSFQSASATVPIVFILSAGADPVKDLFAFAESQNMMSKTKYISLGQGQDKKAEALLDEGTRAGLWILLQNCHLYKSWMTVLAKRVESLDPDTVHRDFRLWLTSMPTPFFPVSILENSIKLVNQPPAGLQANLRAVYSGFTDEYLQTSDKPDTWQKLLWSLSLFHATVLERKKYGALGFNIPYQFTQGDCDVGIGQGFLFLESYDEVPWGSIQVLVTDCNYGGRVTDDRDRRMMSALVEKYACAGILEDGHAFTSSGVYKSFEANTIEKVMLEIDKLPVDAKPEAFGFHPNAEIVYATNEGQAVLGTILSLQPRVSAGAGASREDTIDKMCVDLMEKVPGPYDMEPIMKAYPVTHYESMNTVLQQEIGRYNGLLAVMASSLKLVRKALVGQVVMSDDLDACSSSMYDLKVPDMWMDKGYPSLMPLTAWSNDLIRRLDFLNVWIEQGIPVHFWLPGFFFPQAFLTGTLQNYARKHEVAIDTISFQTRVQPVTANAPNGALEASDITEKPEAGCYIHGLFMEGARWDPEAKVVCESRPKELYTMFVPMLLDPIVKRVKPTTGIYEIPLYKILTRTGTLSTTGHSTNYVCPLEVPSDKPQPHWIGRGVALFTQLQY